MRLARLVIQDKQATCRIIDLTPIGVTFTMLETLNMERIEVHSLRRSHGAWNKEVAMPFYIMLRTDLQLLQVSIQ